MLSGSVFFVVFTSFKSHLTASNKRERFDWSRIGCYGTAVDCCRTPTPLAVKGLWYAETTPTHAFTSEDAIYLLTTGGPTYKLWGYAGNRTRISRSTVQSATSTFGTTGGSNQCNNWTWFICCGVSALLKRINFKADFITLKGWWRYICQL